MTKRKDTKSFNPLPIKASEAKPDYNELVWFITIDGEFRLGTYTKKERFYSGVNYYHAKYWWPSVGMDISEFFPNLGKF